MSFSIPFRRPRIEATVERVPLRWSEFIDVQRRIECNGRYYTVDAIIGGLRFIVSVQRR